MKELPQKYAVIGWPVEHSVSPQMHNAAFKACGINAEYERIPTPPERLSETVEKLRREGYSGWNATVPHKENILPLLDNLDSKAELAGSVNTVIASEGQLIGFSTDGYGLEKALYEAFQTDIKDSSLVFIGAGGATRATAVHFAFQGVKRLTIINRTLEKAQKLCDLINSSVNHPVATPYPIDTPDEWQADILSADVIIQGTSMGLKLTDPLPLPEEMLEKDMCIYDMIYKKTPLLQKAKEKNCRIADGRGMLLHQGAGSFELWTGRKAPVEEMRKTLDELLKSA